MEANTSNLTCPTIRHPKINSIQKKSSRQTLFYSVRLFFLHIKSNKQKNPIPKKGEKNMEKENKSYEDIPETAEVTGNGEEIIDPEKTGQ